MWKVRQRRGGCEELTETGCLQSAGVPDSPRAGWLPEQAAHLQQDWILKTAAVPY